ncbi:MAG: hypothetical protein WAV20_23110, partial [Blastocatellia bacterium]
ECLLLDFVPPDQRREDVPCHHIPLNASGETIDELELNEDQQKKEEDLKNWLQGTIAKLEERRKTV